MTGAGPRVLQTGSLPDRSGQLTGAVESRENDLIAIGVEVRVQWVSEIAVVSGTFKPQL